MQEIVLTDSLILKHNLNLEINNSMKYKLFSVKLHCAVSLTLLNWNKVASEPVLSARLYPSAGVSFVQHGAVLSYNSVFGNVI